MIKLSISSLQLDLDNLNYMSYQKKSLILQELQQAIRKKAQEKSRNKEQVNRVLQGSIQKKKNVLKTATNKDVRVSSIHKGPDTASKQNLPDKPVSIFNNEHLNVFDSNEFKAKKYNNRRLDKLVSLIQYMVSSSEKALRYISSTNFQAEFALKLYRSDRQNLVNQLKNLNFDDIIDSQRTYDKVSKPDQAYNLLLQQNNKLKKQILILEKEAQNYHHKVKEGDSIEIKQHQREISKLKQMLRKLMPFEAFKQIIQLLQKQNKFEIMSIKSQQNSKKTTQIEIVISSLQNERSSIIQSLCKSGKDGKTDRGYKLSQIQAEKEHLQKELTQMKAKLAEIIDSGKSINELQFLKKNSELITEKLTSLHRELNPNSIAKRNSEQLIDHIRTVTLNLQQKNHQLNQNISRLAQQNDILKEDVDRLKEEKKQLQNQVPSEGEEVRMENMLAQIEKLRDIVDELGHSQEISTQRICDLQQELKAKQQQINELAAELSQAVEKSNDYKGIISDLNNEIMQVQNQFNRTVTQNTTLSEKLRATQNDIISNGYSKEELKLIQADNQALAKKLQTANNRNKYLEQQITQLQSQIIQKQQQYQQLEQRIAKDSARNKNNELKEMQMLRNLNNIKQELQFVRKEKQSTQKLMQQQRQRHISQYQSFNNRLHQAELLNMKLSKEKMEVNEQQQVHKQNIQSLNNKIAILQQDIRDLQDEIASLTITSNQAIYEKEHSKELYNHMQEERQLLKNELSISKQHMEDHSQILRSKNKQYVNLLRQILKGLLLDPSEYADKSTFQELLEFGSQQVVQIRKRQREEESNKRKNSRRDYENVSSSQFNQNSLQECKAQLFAENYNNILEQRHIQEENIDLDEFNQLKQQPNDSMISEQNRAHIQEDHQGAYLQQFKDHQSQVNESMVSNDPVGDLPQNLSLHSNENDDEACNLPQKLSVNSSEEVCHLPQKLSLNSVHHSQTEQKKQQGKNDQNPKRFALTSSQVEVAERKLSQFNEIEENVSESMISLQQQAIQIIILKQKQKQKQPVQREIQLPNQIEQSKSENFDEEQYQKDANQGLENQSMLFQLHLNLQQSLQNAKLKPPSRASQGYSKHTLNSIAIRNQKLDLDEFQEVKSVEGNYSFVSSSQNIDSHRQYAFNRDQEEEDELKDEDGLKDSEVQIYPLEIKNLQKGNDEMNIEAFQQMGAQPMSESMLSQKMEEHNDIDEFGDIQTGMMSQSMISTKEKQQQINIAGTHHPQKKQEELGLQQFGEVENNMNDSMLSQKKSEHGLSQFGQLPEDRLNESLMSEKHEVDKQEHGMSQFGQVQQNQMNDSLLSDTYNLMNSNRSADKNDIDEFDEYKSEKMSQSMISETEGASGFKNQEGLESP